MSRGFSSGALRITALALFAGITARSAELNKETLDAWNAYITGENAKVKQRASEGHGFFWADAVPDRFNEIRTSGPFVSPEGEHNPTHIVNGLIHHWVGAIFIPDATIADVFSVTRDYAHYKDYYKPGVADAAVSMRSAYRDEFTIRFVNPSILSKTSLQGSYVTDFVQVNPKRWYTVSETTSMCEIKNFGCPNEKRLQPDEGSGYIWRLYSTGRLEERDGGVLLEIEAIALSRDIPGALRWFVDPIVRRISRDSLAKSLTDTSDAVRERDKACAAQNAKQSAMADSIIESGNCSRHAGNSGVWSKELAGNPGR
jgi:hypothetical protein